MDYAKEFLQSISKRAKRTNRILIFEMGTSEEKEMFWSDDLPSMPNGQNDFITSLLREGNFCNIEVIGESLSIAKDTKRLLFKAEPRNS